MWYCYCRCPYENKDGECTAGPRGFPSDGYCRDEHEHDHSEYEPELDAQREHDERQIEHAERLLDEWRDEGKPPIWRGRRMPQC